MVDKAHMRKLQAPYKAPHPEAGQNQAVGAHTSTTAEEQLLRLKIAWDEVNESEKAQLGLLSNREKARKVLEETNMGHTPERVLHLLGIQQAPEEIGPVLPAGPGFIYT